MPSQIIKPLPISLNAAGKRDVRTQFAALCWRETRKKPEILLITSRGTKRWILPKGWPMDGLTPAECAAQEAWEEAGVKGRISHQCIGIYSYMKRDEADGDMPCIAMIYPLRVKSLAQDFPEAGQRRRKWLPRKKAAQRLSEDELAHIVRAFDPSTLA